MCMEHDRVPSTMPLTCTSLFARRWATVCYDPYGYFSDKEAKVVCRMLGRTGGKARGNAVFGQGTLPNEIGDFGCTGDEASLTNCSMDTSFSCARSANEDAGVQCDGRAHDKNHDPEVVA